ncbi:TetR/AcrR family transcriptional regulator [Nocardioides sp. CER19]|uniref:TetR/AcrR family transcriptional regulator n=1 Tax=Nocardioides sp. CER19 TaxID=3038538 RepID=UPI00244B65D5|nr:TetR/AcrR family transcriptional regulator [Nocardioides sp. CER19]MDH2414359.1 TetR family transcriptional regulator [Nocardioides sp. CER19]
MSYGTGRQALLEAAIRVVASEGLRGMTYRSVAAEAGVSHASVRYHFGDWSTMLEEALAYCLETSASDTVLASTGPGFDGFADALIAMVTRDPDIQAFQYELTLEARRRPELRRMVERVDESYRELVRRELTRNGIDDPDVAEAVYMTLDGLVLHQTTTPDAERTDRALVALRRLLANDAAARDAARSPA